MTPRRSYHIVAPPYTEASAGAKALHMLCHELNQRGETAYIHPYQAVGFNLDLNTPRKEFELGDKNAVVVYPEIILGNPLEAEHVARWLLYYAGRYRGNRTFGVEEKVWGYTTRIAKDYGTDKVLFLSTVDKDVFKPIEGVKRKGSCFYANKYRHFYGGAVTDPDVLAGIEITTPGQSREEIIKLLQTSEVLYTYEDTALVVEAVLCGCPVVCIPNEHFTECCGLDDFSAGIAWGKDEFGKAWNSVGEARNRYLLLKDVFQAQLTKFIEDTQA